VTQRAAQPRPIGQCCRAEGAGPYRSGPGPAAYAAHVGASLTLSDPALAAVPGGAVVMTVSIVNTGAAVDEVAVSVEGEAAAWAAVEPHAVVLFPGAEGQVAVTFRVPDGPRSRPGPVPFAVRAVGSSDPAAARADGVLDVAPYAEAALSLRPDVLQGARRATGSVVVENRGNARADLHLVGSADQASVSIEPPVVAAGPGETVSAILTVSPDRSFLRGPGQRLPFRVTAEGTEHPTITVEGTLAQRARLPQGGAGLLAGLLVLALLLPLAWFGALLPLVRREAEREVARNNPSAIGPGSGRPGTGAASAVGGNPIDGRLFLTAPGSTSFTVPAGRTLRVTDIVLQNPGANTGALRVKRGDQVLLEVGLENFRSQDFHFVTPITFASEQKLVLEAECTGAAAGGATGCTPSALFSALLG